MDNIVDRYNKLTAGKYDLGVNKKVKTHIPKPTEFDYKKGYLVRYFCQKTNDKGSPIYEVNSNQFSTYKSNPYYEVVSLRWRIRGPKNAEYDNGGNILDKSVSESNRIAISLVKNKIPNLKLYLPNLLQFYKN